MRIILLAAISSTLVFSSPAASQTSSFDTRKMINSFSENNLASAFTHRKIEILKRSTLKSGTKLLSLKFANGYKGNVTFQACKKTTKRCVGMQLYYSWKAGEHFTPAQNREFTAKYNNKYSYIKSGVSTSGFLYISRYVIADHGITNGTLATDLRTFENFIKIFNTALAARGAKK